MIRSCIYTQTETRKGTLASLSPPTGFMSSTLMNTEDDGFPLIEIFNIIYKGNTLELKPEEQRGTIKISSLDGVLYVYNVDKIDESMSSIKFLDDILVTSKVPFCAFPGHIDMQFDLFDGAYKGDVSLDWEVPEHNEVIFDEVHINSHDNTGDIVVRIGSFANAVVARLMVKLYLGDSASTYVYGVVCASNSRLDVPHCTSVLFAKKEDNGVQLHPDGVIPLSKSCVAVPLGSELYVDVAVNVNGVDHKVTKTFAAHTNGVFAQPIHLSNDSKIQVQVTWDDDDDGILSSYDRVCEDMMNVG